MLHITCNYDVSTANNWFNKYKSNLFSLLQFVKNLRGTNGGGDHDPEMLTEIYHAIRQGLSAAFLFFKALLR